MAQLCNKGDLRLYCRYFPFLSKPLVGLYKHFSGHTNLLQNKLLIYWEAFVHLTPTRTSCLNQGFSHFPLCPCALGRHWDQVLLCGNFPPTILQVISSPSGKSEMSSCVKPGALEQSFELAFVCPAHPDWHTVTEKSSMSRSYASCDSEGQAGGRAVGEGAKTCKPEGFEFSPWNPP